MVFKMLVYKEPPYEDTFPCIVYGEMYDGDSPKLMPVTMEDVRKNNNKTFNLDIYVRK